MENFDPKMLTEKQKTFLKENAYELWLATMVPPSDDIESILDSTCNCCSARRVFLKKIMDI